MSKIINLFKSKKYTRYDVKIPVFKLSVIIPVYNNGHLLKERAMESLKRSSIFEYIEIIIVDDGSDDNVTKEIIQDLDKEYENVKIYLFDGESSKSASRPRNMGLELATTKYISYLDPDDESINDGYYKLYEEIEYSKCDVVIGNMVNVSDSQSIVKNYYRYFLYTNKSTEVEGGRDLLIKMRFEASNLQGLIIKKEIITKNNMSMVVGGIGQDTLFFYEIILNSKKIKVINKSVCKHYNNLKTSVTNSININYFKGHLIKEEYKKDILVKNELLNSYLDIKMDNYFKSNILEKLKYIDENNFEEAEFIAYQIYELYKNEWIIKDNFIENYVNKLKKNYNNDLKISVIVAIYNNGKLLLNRSFKSLKQSSIFENLEIILVDDGSTDNDTVNIVKYLENKYSNVKTYYFETGGSGSASRPRNKGLEISTCEYISYLDPDDECINDCQKKLYDEILEYNLDAVIGNIVYNDDGNLRVRDYYNKFLKVNYGLEESYNCRKILVDSKFESGGIFPFLVKKDVLLNNNISMVEGGLGEDTLFFYEIMLCINKVKVINDGIYMYYRHVENSVTTKIDLSYFVKHLKKEKIKRSILEKYNVLEEYLDIMFDSYFNQYLLAKLNKVDESELEKAKNVIDEIYKTYSDVWNVKYNSIKNYVKERRLDEDKNLILSVIIPIFNNGEYLKERAFNSLQKSSIFESLEIILVDDGSTDNKTLDIIKELENDHSNVKAYYFETGGSGSASRPRNKGIEISTTNYISYIDPDDECINDCHAVLYENIIKYNIDIVVGNVIYSRDKGDSVRDYYDMFIKSNDNSDISYNCKDILLKTNFASTGILSILVNKSVILDKKLEMVEGGVGQDTLFSYELMLNCKSIKVVNESLYYYYANVSNSITNTIGVSYFKKHLITEKAKKKVLEEHGILEVFLDKKYDEFFRVWIYEKMRSVKEEEKEEAQIIADEIYYLYKDKWRVKHNGLKEYFESRKFNNNDIKN